MCGQARDNKLASVNLILSCFLDTKIVASVILEFFFFPFTPFPQKKAFFCHFKAKIIKLRCLQPVSPYLNSNSGSQNINSTKEREN